MPRAKAATAVKAKKASYSKGYAAGRAYSGYGAYRSTSTRKATTVRGRGDYKFSKKMAPSMGARAGAFIGDQLGSLLGNLPIVGGIARAVGLGDYKIKHNVLMETNGPPSVVNDGRKFIIRHREYIGDIYSASGSANTASPFAIQSFPLNPGVAQTFPWLAEVANNFDEYKMEGVIFEFKSLYSDAVVTQNGSIGSVILATAYNASNPPFTSKAAMENYEYAQSCKPSHSVMHPIECSRSETPLTELYIRTGSLAANQDIKTYDWGTFQIASQGIPLGSAGAAVDLGELWVTYQITLMKPKSAQAGAGVEPDFMYTHYTGFGGPATYTASFPLGPVSNSNITQQNGSTFALTFNPTSRVISIPKIIGSPARYMLIARWVSNVSPATTWKAPSFTTSSDITINGAFLADPLTAGANNNGIIIQLDITVPAQTDPLSPVSTYTLNTDGAMEATGTVTFDFWLFEKPLLS